MVIILLILDGSQCTKKCHLSDFWIVYKCCNKVLCLFKDNVQDEMSSKFVVYSALKDITENQQWNVNIKFSE